MQLPPDSVIEERLVKTFPNTRLRELARATGLIQRESGKLKADALFWSLAIGFLSGNYRTLEEFRQEYIDTFGGSLEYSSFHEWFMPSLCEFLREVLQRALEDLEHENDRLQGRFEQFREVFIADMTVITLYQSLFETFPGYGDDHAGAKLHVVEAVSSGLPAEFSITDARTHEFTQLSTGPWVENALLLFDQAYFDYRTMDLIDTNGGWFLTRLKPNANPEITAELRKWRGDAISLEGKQVQNILDDLHRDVIDVDGEVGFKRRIYNGTRSRAVETFRVVGVWNDEEERYHLYITNLPAENYCAADIAKLYQARWEVELLFRELKTTYGLDELNSGKPEVVEALILIGLLSLVVSRTLRELFIEIIEEQQDDDSDDVEASSLLPRERWARAFGRRSDRILRRVAKRLGYEPPKLVKSLLNDALNPNAHRISLLDEVQHEPFAADLA
ncbi:IS4 family transposase [Halococcus sediminicola]|uniref:IS4 family transposase n=1 Tax=Halococcus sediminicola TaxID=1264579 RepID=UPI000B2FA66E|nr:IS4 family transposase [Halococcus sediminicola]